MGASLMRIPIIFIFSVESQSFFVTVFWIAVTVRCHISDGDRPDECWHDRIHPFCTPGKGLDLFWRRVMLPLLGAAVAASSSRAIIRRSALLDGQAVLPRRRRARLEGRHRSFYKFRSA